MAGMLEYKCPCCDGAIQFDSATQKMKCPYCDTEFEVDTLKDYDEELKDEKPSEMEWATPGGSWAEGETAGLHTYSCKSCGGEIVGDDTMAASACPFCGNPIVLTGQFAGTLRPDLIIPFKLDKKAAKAKLQEHLKGKTLLPRVFRSQNHIDEIKGVYVPFWLFDSDADAQLRFTATRTRSWSDNKYDYTEFSGFDLEFSYITSFRDVMKMEEELLKAGLAAVKEAYGEQIQEAFGQEVIVPETPFPVVKLADLYKGLEEEFGYTVDDSEKGDLTTEAERLSYEWVKKHYGHEFLFITDYSAEKRAFYHMRDENGVPQGYDLIWRGVEITTGAQREHRYEVLKKQAEEKGLAEDVKFYLEFFQYGCPPHGGFGLGIDRLTMLLCGLPIKEAEFLFRGPNRLTP